MSVLVLQEDSGDVELIARVAALDVAKAEVVCCVRVPGPEGQRMQEVRTFSSMTQSLLELGDWLASFGVTRVVMESTGEYWRAPFYLLEDRFETWLVDAKQVKHLPGRPKTDRLDAMWLCKVAERQMLRPCFVPPLLVRQLRDLTRYRVDLVAARTAEKQRVEKLLEDALIKVSVVVSDLFGVSGRAMMAALIGGERDPEVLAGMARGRMLVKHDRLVAAFTGRFTDHHGFLLGRMVDRVDRITADIDVVQQEIDRVIAPFDDAVARLDEIPGVAKTAAQAIVAEIGTDMTRFPTPGQLASWAGFAPGINESAGRRTGTAGTGHGNRYLGRALGEAAIGAARTNTFLGARYKRLVRRRGKPRSLVAVGRSILVIIWHLLHDPSKRYAELGADYYDKQVSKHRKVQNHVRDLKALGFDVTLKPAA